METSEYDVTTARVGWRCRRGMLELDRILMPFFEQYFHQLSNSDQQTFISLLEQDDPVLYDWIFKADAVVDPCFHAIIEHITSTQQVIKR